MFKLSFFTLLTLSTVAYANVDISEYKNCTGVSLRSFNIQSSTFENIDSYKHKHYDYAVVLDKSNKFSTECLVISKDRKVILDIIPSLVSNTCSGQWDQRSKSPLWVGDVGGGKDGVNRVDYINSEQLRQIRNSKDPAIKEIIASLNCQLPTYTNYDIEDLNNSAFYLYKMKYFKDSINILDLVLKLDPNRTVAYLNIGDSYLELGNIIRAKENYKIYVTQMKKRGLDKKIPVRINKYLY